MDSNSFELALFLCVIDRLRARAIFPLYHWKRGVKAADYDIAIPTKWIAEKLLLFLPDSPLKIIASFGAANFKSRFQLG